MHYHAAVKYRAGGMNNMKKRNKEEKEKIRIYVPEKERIKRIQQQIMLLNRTIIAA